MKMSEAILCGDEDGDEEYFSFIDAHKQGSEEERGYKKAPLLGKYSKSLLIICNKPKIEDPRGNFVQKA
jgi:hypothetical protein